MQKNKFFAPRALVLGALCAALSVVLGKLLQIPIGDSIRLSFENLPIILASLVLGETWGGIVGVVADLVGCAIMGYAVNPYITCAACLIGVLPALFLRLFSGQRVFLPVLLTHIIASMFLKSLGLYLYFGTPLFTLLLRVPIYLVIACLESAILRALISGGVVSLEQRRRK